jgi:multiple sugar transport system substrate-binding protein
MHKSLRFFLVIVVVGAALGLALTSGPVQAQQNVSGKIRIAAWESADALEPYNKAIEAFKKANPNVEVQLESVPQDYGTKLLAQFAAGDAPDVFEIGDGDVAKWQSLGAVEPLDKYLKGSNPLDINVFYPSVAAFGQVKGETFFLTKDYSPLVLWYNAAHFKEAGIDVPSEKWTWDDMLNAAQLLTKDASGNNAKSDKFDATKIARYGLLIPDSWGDPLWTRGILPLIYQGGGKLVSDDGKTTTGYMNGKETVAALQWYVDLFKKYHVAPSKAEFAAYSGTDLFSSGLASMQWSGRWPLKDYMKNTALDFGIAGLPAGPKDTRANALCWAGFGIYSGSKNKDAAWALLKFIAAEDGAKEFANYAFTAVKSIAESQGLSTDKYNAPIIKDLPNAKTIPETLTPFWADCGDKAFHDNLEQVFLKDVSVQAAMDAAAKQADACLAEKAKS